MLQSIRDNTQGWIAGVIISLLILSFSMWGIHSYLGGGGASNAVAKVNGIEISKSQLTVAYERLRRQLQMQFNSSYQLPQQAEANLKQRALQALVNLQVLEQASQSQNYRISSSQIDNFLEGMPEFQVNGQFSAARFQQVLETTLYNANDFFDLIKTSLLIDQPRLGLIFTSFALPDEIVDSIALVNQERNIQFAVLTPAAVANQPIQISDEQIQAYYKQHEDEFKTPEQASIDYVQLSLKGLMANIHPTDEMVKNFYTENSSSYTQPMQWKIETILLPLAENATDKEVDEANKKADAILQKAKAGTDFAKLVPEYSVQKGDAKLQGWITIDKVPAELQKAVMDLSKSGQVTKPVRTINGIVLIKAVDIKQSVAQSFAEVKDKVKAALIHQQAEEKFADMREKLANISYEHFDSLAFTAKELGLTINTSELFTKDKGGKDLTANNKLREAAFSNEVLNQKNNSDVIQLDGDNAIVLRIKTHAPATLLSLNTVQKSIVDKLKAAEIEARVAHTADEIKQKLQSGTTPDQVAQQYHLTWNKVGFIGRHSNKVDSAISNIAFASTKPQSDNKPTFATAKVPTGYAVIALYGVKDGAMSNDRKQYQVFAEQIQNTQGLLEYELYKQSLIQQAKITTDSN